MGCVVSVAELCLATARFHESLLRRKNATGVQTFLRIRRSFHLLIQELNSEANYPTHIKKD